MNIIYKPGECMKHMNIEIHPTLSHEWYAADISREVSAAGASVILTRDLFDPSLVMWSRNVPRTLTTCDEEVKLSVRKQPCSCALYVRTASEVEGHVANHTLSSHLLSIRNLVQCELTLVVFGAKEYFKSSRRKTSNSNRKLMTEIDLEMAITDLLVSADCDTVIVNTPNELALLIAQFTKAIAEEPNKTAKRAYDEQADFYMRGDNKKCVPVDKDGNGVSNVWQQMLAILPNSSLETSRAICSNYNTPKALFEAFKSPGSINELADIGVARAVLPGSKVRRIGPEFARRLHTLFTSEDGSVLLD